MIRGGRASEVDYRAFQQKTSGITQLLIDSFRLFNPVSLLLGLSQTQLAFLINAYNAYTIELILTRYPQTGFNQRIGFFLAQSLEKEVCAFVGENVFTRRY